MKISNLVSRLSPSMTLMISGKAKQMKRQGVPVIDFSVGEPDFNTPENIKSAGIHAIETNCTGYTQSDGIPELKAAIINRLRVDNDIDYLPNEIIVSTGAKMSLYLVMAAILNPGDEVIVPAPFWVSYPEQVKLNGATPVIVDTLESNGFLLTPNQLLQAITPQTRAVILNNPSNPTGAAYDRDQLRSVLTVAHEKNLIIIADEIYSKITYSGFDFVRSVSAMPETKSHTVLIDGASKAYSMTGWRIGYAAGPVEIIKGMKGIQGHLTSNPVSISQHAAVEAFRGDQQFLEQRTKEFLSRRDYLLKEFNEIEGVSVTVPRGAFYLFPNVSKLFGKCVGDFSINTAYELCEYLLDSAHVALVPGEGFGAPDNIRLSFATSMDNIKEGVSRIKDALSKLN